MQEEPRRKKPRLFVGPKFPRIPYTGSPVSEKTSSRSFVNRGNLPSSVL